MSKLKLEILNENGETVLTHIINYNETLGKRMRLSIENNNYIMDNHGKLIILTQKEIERENQRLVSMKNLSVRYGEKEKENHTC